MKYEFKLPDIGEGVTEGEIVEWHVRVGDVVKEDQPLVDVMTDKASVTITSPKSGRIAELNGAKGQVVKVFSVLVVFDLSGGAVAAPMKVEAPAKSDGPAATAVGDIKESLPGMGAMTHTATVRVAPPVAVAVPPAPSVSAAPSAPQYEAPGGKALATPATRKLARDLGVELTRVRPTGPASRVTKDDVRAYHNGVVQPAAPPAEITAVAPLATPFAAPVAAPVTTLATLPARAPVAIARAGDSASEAPEERVPFTGIRRKIADRMSQSVHTAAHFTFVEECDVTALKALRDRMRPKAQARGVKLTFLPFIVKAAVAALKKHPVLNTALDESTNELVYRKYYNIGIAASSEAGLVVPVVKHADRKNILDVARDIDRMAQDVKAGKTRRDDLQGSTFTITSLGAQGGLFATPIINFPEVAILGVHQIKQKPVVRDGQIVIGDVMLLSLSFDHRVVDGHVGAAFAYEIIHYLQDPDSLWLES